MFNFLILHLKQRKYIKDLIERQGLFLKKIIPDPENQKIYEMADSAQQYIDLIDNNDEGKI